MRKTLTALILAVIMAAAPLTAFAEERQDDHYVPLREFVYDFAEQMELEIVVEWDGENRAALIGFAYDVFLLFYIEERGGFIEDGVAFIPLEAAHSLARILLSPALTIFEPEPRVDRVDLTIWEAENFADVREPAFPSTDVPHGEISVYYIRHMNDHIPGRSAFTYRELEAAIWIVEELLAMGHDWDNIEIQEFTYWDVVDMGIGLFGLSWWQVTSPMILGVGREYLLRPDRVSQNVVLTLPGQSERKIIVGAHYDSPPYPSASDNASGTALLMESAQRMLEIDHYYTIVYVFFGAEEVGLIGAYYYLETLTPAQSDNIVMMINADVIIEGPYLIFGTDALPNMDDVDDEFLDELREILFESQAELIAEIFHEIMADIDNLGIVPGFETLEEFLDMQRESMYWMPPQILIMNAAMMGLIEPNPNLVVQQVLNIAEELSDLRDFELLHFPEIAMFPTDSLAFIFAGHTVVNFVGMERMENIPPELAAQLLRLGEGVGDFTVTILHTPLDEFDMIEYLWPGMIAANMYGFSVFLEALLTARYH